MPQMGPMNWFFFLFMMLVLVVIFVVMIHDSGLSKIELEKSEEENKAKKWW